MPARRTAAARTGALALAVALLAGPPAAWAGSCSNTERDFPQPGWGPVSVHTTVHNETSSTDVTFKIERGPKELTNRTVGPGGSGGYLYKISQQDANKKTFRVALTFKEGTSSAGTSGSADCAYVIGGKSEHTTWRLESGADSVCTASAAVTIECDKSYHKQKIRWNTSFTIKDPAS